MANYGDNHAKDEPDLMDARDVPPDELENLQETLSESDAPIEGDA